MRGGNLEDGIPSALPDEAVTALAGAGPVRVERIVSRGHASPERFWYDQDEVEFVVLVAGAAVLELDDGSKHPLRPGEWLEIPPHVRHRVDWTDPDRDTVWLAVFYPDPERPSLAQSIAP